MDVFSLSFQRGLCCFPGFSNTSTAPRKGKLPKPLLASVGSTSPHHLFEPGFLQGLVPARYDQERPEEILLLEKQGRSSQQQRAGSLPPTSLPRPRRTHKQPDQRRLGEYGRLSDGENRKVSVPVQPQPQSLPPRSSNIPTPRKLGEYGRLGDGGETQTTSRSLKKPSVVRSTKPRDSASIQGEETKLRLFSTPKGKRGSSLTRDGKPPSTDSSNGSSKSVASTGKYRIQF